MVCGEASMCLLLHCVVVVTLCVVGSSSTGYYSGHSVIRITPKSEQQVNFLKRLLDYSDLDLWRESFCVLCHVDVRLSPRDFSGLTSFLREADVDYRTVIADVQDAINVQKRVSQGVRGPGFHYSRYHSIDDIHKWVHNMSHVYKDITSTFNVAHSYEGRPLLGLKISTSSAENKPAFWLQGGIHAREWVSPATVIYMVGQMLDNYKTDRELTNMVDMFDWYILPVMNPDGYAYTWKGDDTRLWRKTRSFNGDDTCMGVDGNRNWGVAFGGFGSSGGKCSYTYHGPAPFSEPEVEGVANFLSTIKNLKGFIDFHSYGQLWMCPYGYINELPKDYLLQNKGARLAVEAVENVHGTKYKYGNHAETIYVASGISIDWVYDILGVKYAYVVELRDDGKHAFLLPEDQILPTATEMLEGLKTIAKYVHEH